MTSAEHENFPTFISIKSITCSMISKSYFQDPFLYCHGTYHILSECDILLALSISRIQLYCISFFLLNFIYSEKAKNFCENSTVDLSYVVPVKSTVEISQNFVAFSEYMKVIVFKVFSLLIYCSASFAYQMAR